MKRLIVALIILVAMLGLASCGSVLFKENAIENSQINTGNSGYVSLKYDRLNGKDTYDIRLKDAGRVEIDIDIETISGELDFYLIMDSEPVKIATSAKGDLDRHTHYIYEIEESTHDFTIRIVANEHSGSYRMEYRRV